MPDPTEAGEPGQLDEPGLTSVLADVARRLTSQPLLYGLGVLLLLVIAAGLVTEALSALVLPALAIFVVGLIVWVVVEFPKVKAASSREASGSSVNVDASEVGTTGSVTGISGLPERADLSAVKVKAKNIKGPVLGAGYASAAGEQEPDGGERPKP